MNPLYTQDHFEKAKNLDLLPFKCQVCNQTFFRTKKVVVKALNGYTHKCECCSMKCAKKMHNFLQEQLVNCKQCDKFFLKRGCQIKKSPNHFCCRSCSVTYNNTHKTHGTRRSKLEVYIEQQLVNIYPELEFMFNKKDAINSELDIYIPSLNLAFELNGLFHYEPIFGPVKLSKIQNNDQRKFQACLEKNIELVIIDTSGLKYFKKEKASIFLCVITNIIDQKLIK